MDAARSFRLIDEARIGSASNPDDGFTSIEGVAIDRDGHIHVFEARDQQIRVFSSAGRLIRTIGRAGTGPGEFQQSILFGVVLRRELPSVIFTLEGVQ